MGGIVQSAMLVACRNIVTAPVQFQLWIGTFWTKTRMDWIWDLGIGLGLVNFKILAKIKLSVNFCWRNFCGGESNQKLATNFHLTETHEVTLRGTSLDI